MTFDEALAKVTAKIDAVLEHRRDAFARQVFLDWASEASEEDRDDNPNPLDWDRVEFNDVLLAQKGRDLQWRDATIAKVRAGLEKEFGQSNG